MRDLVGSDAIRLATVIHDACWRGFVAAGRRNRHWSIWLAQFALQSLRVILHIIADLTVLALAQIVRALTQTDVPQYFYGVVRVLLSARICSRYRIGQSNCFVTGSEPYLFLTELCAF